MQIRQAQLHQKLGYGFIFFGLLFILGLYFAVDGGAYVFMALLGVMAIVFGGFQLMLAKQPARTARPTHKGKKARR